MAHLALRLTNDNLERAPMVYDEVIYGVEAVHCTAALVLLYCQPRRAQLLWAMCCPAVVLLARLVLQPAAAKMVCLQSV